MNKTEKYNNLKKTLQEVTEQKMNLVSVKSTGAEVPYRGGGVLEQEYTIWFSNSSRHLILSTEAVAFALEENLGKIKESIRYFAHQKIEGYLKAAKEETQKQLDALEKVNLNFLPTKE